MHIRAESVRVSHAYESRVSGAESGSVMQSRVSHAYASCRAESVGTDSALHDAYA